MAKPWQTTPPRGSATALPAVRALAQGHDPGTSPTRLTIDGRVYVTSSRTRLYLDREAWEMLPANGVLVQRIRPSGRPHFTIALTRDELEAVFGSVRSTKSWQTVRCYHFKQLPPAVWSFRVFTE